MTSSAQLSRMCRSSGVGEFCSPARLDGEYRKRLPSLVSAVIPVERGETLYRQGEKADRLYWIRSGAMKSSRASSCIPESATGLWLQGDLVGLDALSTGRRTDTLTALTSCELGVMPMSSLIEQAGGDRGLMAALLSLLSREILRHEEHMLMIGRASSQQRVALFLIGLMTRTGVGAGPDATVDLYMTREEIAAFLGLRMETVTRRLRELHHSGVIALSGRRVMVHDVDALARSACVAPQVDPPGGQAALKGGAASAKTGSMPH